MDWITILVVVVLAGLAIGAGLLVTRRKKTAWQLPPAPPPPDWVNRTHLEPGCDYCFLRADFFWQDPPSPGNAYIYVESQQANEQLAKNGAPTIFFNKEQELLRDGWEKAYWQSNPEGAAIYFTRPHR